MGTSSIRRSVIQDYANKSIYQDVLDIDVFKTNDGSLLIKANGKEDKTYKTEKSAKKYIDRLNEGILIDKANAIALTAF